MSTAFDFHTLSLTIDHTKAEYLDAIKAGSNGGLGLAMWEIARGDRSKLLRFRHEHAHFTSFVASGLADLYGIFADYILAFTHAILRRHIGGPDTIELPLLPATRAGSIAAHSREIISKAWHQVLLGLAVLVGFGTDRTRREVFELDCHNVFWDQYHNSGTPVAMVKRYYRLISLLAHEQPLDGSAMPSVLVGKSHRGLTTRSVMEAYAITVELLNTHFRKVETDLTYYGAPTVRNPGPLYTAALEYVLEHIGGGQSVTLEQYLSGKASLEAYYMVAAITYAAMQLPILQERRGSVSMTGNLFTVCPAHRLFVIIAMLESGRIPRLPKDARTTEARPELLNWLWLCHRAIGDPITGQIYNGVQKAFDADPELQRMSSTSQSLIDLSWAAHANFYEAPNEYVFDGGLFGEHYPCQPRYVRTSDHVLAFAGEAKAFQAQYVVEHATTVLQGTIFGELWESTWAKMPEIGEAERLDSIKQSLWACGWLCGDADFASMVPQSNLVVCV